LGVVRGLLVFVASMLVALPARAQATPARERVHLAYDAPPACAARATLEAAVAARAPAVVFTPPADGARVFAVVITQTDAGYQGSLAVGSTAGTSSRELAAARCDDLVQALALVIALAIDPAALSAPPAVTAPPPMVVRPSPWRAAALVGGGVSGGVTPGAAPAVAVEARLARRGLGHAALTALLGGSERSVGDGDAAFRWLAGRGSLCWQLLHGPVDADACGHLEMGAINAEGSGIARAHQAARTWLAPGAHAAARWAGRRLLLEVQGGVSVPILRDRYFFDPGGTIHRTWIATPWILVATGVHFW
jgi:hypothetical protein